MKRILISLILLGIGGLWGSLNAQTLVTISFSTAADQTLTVSESGKLYFSDGYLYIDNGSGVPYSFLLSAISKMTFAQEEGIEDIETADLHIYPNPVSDFLRIHNNRADVYTFQLFSCEGRLLQSGKCLNDESIDMSRYAKGLYLLKIDGLTFKISKI
ncbi:MAG: T9SS type A sorting domain-containing protein [Bacteroidales bacterium]|nr:T9SS type A sorting domain-containing protein [Bacteroidales bacterium]